MRMTPAGAAVLGAGVAGLWALARGGGRAPVGRKRLRQRVLEAGAELLQSFTPVKQFDAYLVGFHPMKLAPHDQMEAHHYGFQLSEELMQCAIFDGNGKSARLVGLEYIISERLYGALPEAEKPYWHPHNYEILSGQLVAPGLPEIAERQFMKLKMNSYGKTWHTWMPGADALSQRVPLGPPMLAWSFNHDGEVREALVRDRDRRLGTDTGDRRRSRAGLRALARPQRGVDALCLAFPNARGAPEGIAAQPEPTI